MNIKKIGLSLNFVGNKSPKIQAQSQKLNYEIKDTVSFSGKKNKEVPEIYGIDYSEINSLDKERTRTIPELKEALKKGEDISEDKVKLILSRIPVAIKDGENFVNEHQEFEDSKDDIIQDLILMVAQNTEKELQSDSEYSIYGTCYAFHTQKYFNELLKQQPQMGDFVEEETPSDEAEVQDVVEDKIRDGYVRELVDSMPEPKKTIIEMRYGFDDGEKKSQKEVGRALGCSSQNISLYERNALKRAKRTRIFTEKIKDFD